MKNRLHWIPTILALSLLAVPLAALADDEIVIKLDYVPGKEKPIPVSLSGISGEAAEVIQFDLTIQGFTFTGPEGAQYLLSGSANGNLVGRAQDAVSKEYKVNNRYTSGTLREQAHTFVNDFLAKLGRKGIGNTRIAFKRDNGS